MDKRAEILSNIRLFVLDMDGTFYISNEIINGSLEFLKKVEGTGKEYLFFTNNSSRTSDDYIEKLAGMNCRITEKEIMTSGDVTIEYLRQNYSGKRVYLMGTRTLQKSFRDAGIFLTDDEPDVVVAAFDTELTYEKLTKTCDFVRNGAVFLATHLDINCPVSGGFIPDCGSMCAAITLSTGVKPKYLGKPYRETLDMILARTGYKKEQVAFVGDRIYTDVATGVNNGAAGLLVLTGECRMEDVEKSDVKPTAIFESLGEMSEYM